VIGDKKNDYDLGRVIGARPFMVRTGYGNDNANRLVAAGEIDRDDIFDSLLDVARYIKDIEGV